MKKNSFDPFMINNFSDIVKHGRSVSISPNDTIDNDLIGMTFMEKSSSMRIPKVRTGLVLLITSTCFGQENDLGNSLMKSFCDSIASGLELPEYIFLINTGVKLISDESMVDCFKKVKKYGTNIIASFESLEYFKLGDCRFAQKWAMGDIATVLISANKVIKI